MNKSKLPHLKNVIYCIFIITQHCYLPQTKDIITVSFETVKDTFDINEVIFFKNTSHDTFLIFKWNFGDGGTSSLVNPQYFYSKPQNNYIVSLIGYSYNDSSTLFSKQLVINTCPGFNSDIIFSKLNIVKAKNRLRTGSVYVENDTKEDITVELRHPESWSFDDYTSIFPIKNKGLIKAISNDTIKYFENDNWLVLTIGNDWGVKIYSEKGNSCLRILDLSSKYVNNQFVIKVSNLY